MTQTEFIKRYCEKSNISEEKLNEFNKICVPCDCGQDFCQGWTMINKEDIKIHTDLYINTSKPICAEIIEVGNPNHMTKPINVVDDNINSNTKYIINK